MPYTKIWIHAVWSTKEREPLLTKEIRPILFNHIIENARAKGITINCVNGYDEHVHCLFQLPHHQSLSKTMQLIKGEASFWANKNQLVKPSLYWQEEYFATSVSIAHLASVHQYIANQETHHKHQSFQEEYKELSERMGD